MALNPSDLYSARVEIDLSNSPAYQLLRREGLDVLVGDCWPNGSGVLTLGRLIEDRWREGGLGFSPLGSIPFELAPYGPGPAKLSEQADLERALLEVQRFCPSAFALSEAAALEAFIPAAPASKRRSTAL